MKPDKKKLEELSKLSKEEVFAKMKASSERMLQALQSAYEAGMKEGISDDEEDQVIELLQKAKKLRDEVNRVITQESNPQKSGPDAPAQNEKPADQK